jgi:hypothetical protein
MLCFLLLKCLSDLLKLILERELVGNGGLWLQKNRRDAGHLSPMLPNLIFDNLFISIKFQTVGMVGKKNVYWGKSGNRDPGHCVVELYFLFCMHSCDMGCHTHPLPCY